MDDEFAKFMSEISDAPAPAPAPAPAGPRKRGLPAAYANRTNMFSSLKPKVQKIEVSCYVDFMYFYLQIAENERNDRKRH